jgi:FAD/FMN-containing dehydrogenase
MDVLTGGGDLVTVKPGDALFDAFANSYGTLGYATRLRIELEAVPGFVRLRHLRFDDLDALTRTVEQVVTDQAYDGVRIDGLDGVAYTPTQAVLTLATWTDDPGGPTSYYTGDALYYRSPLEREHDVLTMHDYLWRWDTDWFWCSGAFGLHRPAVRRLWPRRWRRSDVYWKLVALDQRVGLTARLDARHGVNRERVVQDVELPVAQTAEFLRWFDAEVGMRPVWLCPLRLREPFGPESARGWPTYPLDPRTTYVNVGFWGTVLVAPDRLAGDLNRAIEAQVSALGGHKSLYSDAYYDEATFASLYGTANLEAVKREVDPDRRLTGLYEKVVGRR